jgi:diguanylate cyclase (GGDEF)-like protein/PAS domain S-box-containing protein
MNKKEELIHLRQENKRLKNLLKIQENSTSETTTIEELVDIKKLNDIFTKFSNLTGYTTGLVKQDSRDVLVSTGWTDICKNFHRGSESSEYICQESNAILTKNLKESHQIATQQCQHGMVDGATPIIIDGEHLADLFSGQILLNKPNIEGFKKGANEFGYDMEKYLKALDDVKIISEDKLKEVLEFLASIATLIAEIGKEKKEYLKLNSLLETKIENRLKETNNLLSLFDESDNVLFKWKNDETWSVAFVSKSVYSLLGYTKEEFEEGKVCYSSCIFPEDISRVTKEVEDFSKSDKNFFKHKPYRIKTKSGQLKWISDSTTLIKNSDNVITYFLGYLSDITEEKNYQDRLEILSRTDQLTKVNNRLYIDEILQKQYYRFFRNDEKCSVILIDIDHFKDVNDTYGHIVGDLFLVEFSNILKTNVRDSDIVGRWGGEEFLIISPHSTIKDAIHLAEKLQHLINSFEFTKVGFKTASFGISEFHTGISSEQLLDNADKALYKSKNNGRNQINSFS